MSTPDRSTEINHLLETADLEQLEVLLKQQVAQTSGDMQGMFRIQLGRVYAYLHRWEDALTHFADCETLGQESTLVQNNVAYVMAREGRTREAYAKLKNLLESETQATKNDNNRSMIAAVHNLNLLSEKLNTLIDRIGDQPLTNPLSGAISEAGYRYSVSKDWHELNQPLVLAPSDIVDQPKYEDDLDKKEIEVANQLAADAETALKNNEWEEAYKLVQSALEQHGRIDARVSSIRFTAAEKLLSARLSELRDKVPGQAANITHASLADVLHEFDEFINSQLKDYLNGTVAQGLVTRASRQFMSYEKYNNPSDWDEFKVCVERVQELLQLLELPNGEPEEATRYDDVSDRLLSGRDLKVASASEIKLTLKRKVTTKVVDRIRQGGGFYASKIRDSRIFREILQDADFTEGVAKQMTEQELMSKIETAVANSNTTIDELRVLRDETEDLEGSRRMPGLLTLIDQRISDDLDKQHQQLLEDQRKANSNGDFESVLASALADEIHDNPGFKTAEKILDKAKVGILNRYRSDLRRKVEEVKFHGGSVQNALPDVEKIEDQIKNLLQYMSPEERLSQDQERCLSEIINTIVLFKDDDFLTIADNISELVAGIQELSELMEKVIGLTKRGFLQHFEDAYKVHNPGDSENPESPDNIAIFTELKNACELLIRLEAKDKRAMSRFDIKSLAGDLLKCIEIAQLGERAEWQEIQTVLRQVAPK